MSRRSDKGKSRLTTEELIERVYAGFKEGSHQVGLTRLNLTEHYSNCIAVLSATTLLNGDDSLDLAWRKFFDEIYYSTLDEITRRKNIIKTKSQRALITVESRCGVVVIVGGFYAGLIGYYDDDEGYKAVVYPMGWEDYVEVPHYLLRAANADEIRLFNSMAPDEVKSLMNQGDPGCEDPKPKLVD